MLSSIWSGTYPTLAGVEADAVREEDIALTGVLAPETEGEGVEEEVCRWVAWIEERAADSAAEGVLGCDSSSLGSPGVL